MFKERPRIKSNHIFFKLEMKMAAVAMAGVAGAAEMGAVWQLGSGLDDEEIKMGVNGSVMVIMLDYTMDSKRIGIWIAIA